MDTPAQNSENMKLSKIAQQVVDSTKKKLKKKEAPVKRKDLLSTGSTLLNLLCSGNPFGGFLKGRYYLIVGDSASGKTFLSMTCFAEASINKRFQDYRLIYDNREDGMLMDVAGLFGEAAAKRIEPPERDKDGSPVYSYMIEDFYYHLDDALAVGTPFIYVLDSMDSVTSTSEESKFKEHKKAHREGKKSPGTYGDGKAKKNSEGLRKVIDGLAESGSILILISQTRDNFGFGFETKSRSGGRALRFYATVEFWSSIIGTIKKTVKGKPRKVGVKIKLQSKKNRITGYLSEVVTEIYPSYGIDDIGSCIDYLVDEKWWTKKENTINAEELDIDATREKLANQILEDGLVAELRSIVGKCWKEIQAASSLKRPKRY